MRRVVIVALGLAAVALSGCGSGGAPCSETALRSVSTESAETRVETDPASGLRLTMVHRETVSACMEGGS
jgi:hypothetical protein